jgi:UDP-N-acetylmuramate--alanine ligase
MFNQFTDLKRIHFVGIGGAGMSGIAEILLAEQVGLEVSGCDQATSEVTDRLVRQGARIAQGHSPDHLEEVDLVVISSAVSEGNAEVQEARRRGITARRPPRRSSAPSSPRPASTRPSSWAGACASWEPVRDWGGASTWWPRRTSSTAASSA